MIYIKSLLKIFCLKFDYMITILINNTRSINKKIAIKIKKDIFFKKLNNIKLDMIK